jgi:hypothetical protein
MKDRVAGEHSGCGPCRLGLYFGAASQVDHLRGGCRHISLRVLTDVLGCVSNRDALLYRGAMVNSICRDVGLMAESRMDMRDHNYS